MKGLDKVVRNGPRRVEMCWRLRRCVAACATWPPRLEEQKLIHRQKPSSSKARHSRSRNVVFGVINYLELEM